jgi:peptide/nickel transport system substrate-binding protein
MARPVALRLALVAALAAALAGCAGDTERLPAGVLVVSQEQTSSWVRNFNPLTPAASARWPTLAGVYEPLFVFNSVRSEQIPWLATGYEWREGNRVLRITTRDSVRWSDGKLFSARDVAFTFDLLKRFRALDRRGVWGFLESVHLLDERTVDFRFQRVFIPGFDEVAAQQIVPEHVWSHVPDPVTFANEIPVGTGPFTQVLTFRSQVYELGRNPYYWQPGKPALTALRFPAYPSNDRANLALVFDEVEWAGNFIPAIDRVFVRRDPARHAYWFPLTAGVVFLYLNTTRPPFDDVRVRKAISMALDRSLMVDVAAFRYTHPADATGMSESYAAWRDSAAAASGAAWMKHDVPRANAILDSLGFARGPDGLRRLPNGRPWRYEVLCVSGWSDWVRASQIIARNLRDVGIEATVRTYDFGAWFERVQEGNFDMSLGWSIEGPLPYHLYRWLMSSTTVKPIGQVSPGNWQRYASPAADSALARSERAADPAEQHRLGAELQRIFAAEAPAIPLYPNPSWAEFNTSRVTGFPTAANPYADPSPNKMERGEILLVLTTLRPK